MSKFIFIFIEKSTMLFDQCIFHHLTQSSINSHMISLDNNNIIQFINCNLSKIIYNNSSQNIINFNGTNILISFKHSNCNINNIQSFNGEGAIIYCKNCNVDFSGCIFSNITLNNLLSPQILINNSFNISLYSSYVTRNIEDQTYQVNLNGSNFTRCELYIQLNRNIDQGGDKQLNDKIFSYKKYGLYVSNTNAVFNIPFNALNEPIDYYWGVRAIIRTKQLIENETIINLNQNKQHQNKYFHQSIQQTNQTHQQNEDQCEIEEGDGYIQYFTNYIYLQTRFTDPEEIVIFQGQDEDQEEIYQREIDRHQLTTDQLVIIICIPVGSVIIIVLVTVLVYFKNRRTSLKLKRREEEDEEDYDDNNGEISEDIEVEIFNQEIQLELENLNQIMQYSNIKEIEMDDLYKKQLQKEKEQNNIKQQMNNKIQIKKKQFQKEINQEKEQIINMKKQIKKQKQIEQQTKNDNENDNMIQNKQKLIKTKQQNIKQKLNKKQKKKEKHLFKYKHNKEQQKNRLPYKMNKSQIKEKDQLNNQDKIEEDVDFEKDQNFDAGGNKEIFSIPKQIPNQQLKQENESNQDKIEDNKEIEEVKDVRQLQSDQSNDFNLQEDVCNNFVVSSFIRQVITYFPEEENKLSLFECSSTSSLESNCDKLSEGQSDDEGRQSTVSKKSTLYTIYSENQDHRSQNQENI